MHQSAVELIFIRQTDRHLFNGLFSRTTCVSRHRKNCLYVCTAITVVTAQMLSVGGEELNRHLLLSHDAAMLARSWES